MSHIVGLQTLSFNDLTRPNWLGSGPRPLVTNIWYPADSTADEAPVLVGSPDCPIFQAGLAARDAEIATTPERFPLIVVSHGTGGATLQLGWLASVLAAHGYVVAGVNHHGNTAIEPYTVEGFVRVWERPIDVTVMLNRLLDDPTFGRRIDWQRIGAAGFSLGGYTAIALAGGVLDLGALLDAYRESGRDLTSLVPPEFPDVAKFVDMIETLAREEDASHSRSYRDERIRAAFTMAPALGEAFTQSGLARIGIPVKIVAGAADTNTPPNLNAERYASLMQGAELSLLEGDVGHYTFLPEGTEFGREAAPDACVDAPDVDRRSIHEQVSGWARDFFDAHLVPS